MASIRTLSLVFLMFLAATALGSSHREALAVLNEPCADNTDTYAWVSEGVARQATDQTPTASRASRAKGIPACNGYRYESIGKGPDAYAAVYARVQEQSRRRSRASATEPSAAQRMAWRLTAHRA